MSKRLTVIPRYTDYTSGNAALEAWESGTDFTSCDMASYGLAVNKTDAKEHGFTAVTIRYKKSTMVVASQV